MLKIKNCPFCGHEPHIRVNVEEKNFEEEYFITLGCGCSLADEVAGFTSSLDDVEETIDECIEKWNEQVDSIRRVRARTKKCPYCGREPLVDIGRIYGFGESYRDIIIKCKCGMMPKVYEKEQHFGDYYGLEKRSANKWNEKVKQIEFSISRLNR